MFVIYNYSRITVFAGHYGSGKTNLAVNYAITLKQYYDKVTIADLDIVNPYFRTKDAEDIIKRAGISLISSNYANTNVDLPSMPPAAAAIFDDTNIYAVIDVGGDDRGAYALGRYSSKMIDADTQMLLVLNKYRPMTGDSKDAEEIMREIENAAGLRFTGIINNSNLGRQTTSEDVLKSVGFAEEIAEKTGLPLVMTSVRRELADKLCGKINNIFSMDIIDKDIWAVL